MKKTLALIAAIATISTLVLAQPPLPPPVVPPKFEMAPNTLPAKLVQESVFSLLASIEANDYANFLRVGDDEFKTDITHEIFGRFVDITAARLEKGYNVVYFGEMKKSPYTIHLWKLVFKDGDRDLLGEISIKDDKVVGFHIH